MEVNGEVVTYEFELPKGEQLTSQEELDDQLGDDFLAYCQKKINEKAVGFNVQMNFKVDEDGNYEPEVYKIVNGKGTPIESDALNTTIDDTIQDYIDNQTPPKTLSKDGNKICKYVMPDPSNFKDEIIEKFSETQGAAVLSLDMNNRKLKIYHEGIEEPSELDLDFKISNQGGELKPKLVYTGTDGVEEEMVLESKELDKEPLTAKELNEAFKARLELDISKAIKDVSDEINKGDITLRAYNPNASSTLAPKP